ncbi:uncharacterized protein KY384_001841 [Bacidia gigantensis]|uniref:uncharacterized protein n=1 Tax=Bacidia gigantensis TaxID=2732470 RepID=UPI001D03D295|nr:uncharacterized protein KY384_001841 [Bacidia gigantensis]KAG8533058.1 hypothetical protein KY384_001841 [Bacidia gigantensis]
MVLLAAGVLTASALFLAYRYLYPKLPPPRLQVDSIDDDDLKERETLTFPGVSTREQNDSNHLENHELEHVQSETPDSPDTTPKQKPQDDRNLMPPPLLLNGKTKPGSSLMPPPPRPTANIPKPSSALRPPPSAASTLRTPPTRSSPQTKSNTLAPSTSTLPPLSRPSKKVLLSPGHSPLDWAALTKSPPSASYLRGADVPADRMIRVTPSMLKYYTGRKGKDAWGVFGGKVYNMTRYLDFHPGGKDEIMKGAGRLDGTALFLEAHPWVSWESMLGECCVGILVGEGEGEGEKGSRDRERMEQMD